jgi:XTP/dITP diphosphohydrolase
MVFVLATANEHKVREILTVFARSELLPRPSDLLPVDESADTLYGNAVLKARAVAERTGKAALADDTGLVVDAQQDILGTHTARFEPEATDYRDKMAAIVRRLDGVPQAQRSARFLTVALAYFPDGRILHAEGRLEGYIAENPDGLNGFGYDPIFVPFAGTGGTFASMSFADRVKISHRTRAFRTLRESLNS